MRKCFIAVVALVFTTISINAQENEKPAKKFDLSNRPNDHIVLQYGYTGWSGAVPDSVKPDGFSRHFNIYFMYDKPFKDNQHLSWGVGIGLGTDNIFFDKKYVNIKAATSTLPFDNQNDQNHFKKFKLATMYVDLPVELRYSSNPVHPDKGYKLAIGAKVGLLMKVHTKGKDFQDEDGRSIYGGKYIQKEYSKNFFNTTRLAAIGRVGYGNFSLSGSYQITTLLKTGAGPDIRPFSIGLTVSGL